MSSSLPSQAEKVAQPTPESLWADLQTVLPDRFPADFAWTCTCSISGFPGCSDLKCFARRVCLAITDYHQMEESKARGVVRPQQVLLVDTVCLLRPDQFRKERKKAYQDDLSTAITILKEKGVSFPRS